MSDKIDFQPIIDFEPLQDDSKDIWHDDTLAGRDARVSALGDAVSKYLTPGIKAALPSSEALNPISPEVKSSSPWDVVKGAADAAFQTLRDPSRISPTLSQPAQAAGEKVDQELTDSGSPILGTLAGGATSLILDPQTYLLGGVANPKGLAKVGSAMEEMGAKGQNFAAGLRPQTIEAMTRSGQNPGDIGVMAGSKLAQDGIIGSTGKETFANLLKAKDKGWQQVKQAIKNINQNGLAAINVNDALVPLNSKINTLRGAATKVRQNMATHFEEVRDWLAKRGEENGMISLDDVKTMMKEIGPLTQKGSDEIQAAMSELYGTLANTQDTIVSKIADQADNPEIKNQLLKANQNYSFYARISPDIERFTAKEAVGRSEGFKEGLKRKVERIVSGPINKTGTKLKKAGKTTDNLAGFSLGSMLNESSRKALQHVQYKDSHYAD